MSVCWGGGGSTLVSGSACEGKVCSWRRGERGSVCLSFIFSFFLSVHAHVRVCLRICVCFRFRAQTCILYTQTFAATSVSVSLYVSVCVCRISKQLGDLRPINHYGYIGANCRI